MASGFRNLLVYQKGFSLAMEIYELIKSFPSEEKYGLSSQIRNSSRSDVFPKKVDRNLLLCPFKLSDNISL